MKKAGPLLGCKFKGAGSEAAKLMHPEAAAGEEPQSRGQARPRGPALAASPAQPLSLEFSATFIPWRHTVTAQKAPFSDGSAATFLHVLGQCFLSLS